MFLFFTKNFDSAYINRLYLHSTAAQYISYNFSLTKQLIEVPEYKLIITFLISYLSFLDGWTFLSILGNIASQWISLLKQHNAIKVVKTET